MLKKMITKAELNKLDLEIPPDIDRNLDILLERMNVIRKAYNRPMIVTSGLRTIEKQEQLIKDGKSNAHASKHLTGEAVDIYDPDGELWKWCMIHMDLLVEVGLWLEDKRSTPSWTHFQSVPPHSGKRIFIP